MSLQALYTGREQTLIKHLILRRYLARFAHIVGQRWDSITYVDCFAGPWKHRSERCEDTSFGIALQELRRARHTLHGMHKHPRLRCYFLEKDPEAYRQLRRFADSVGDVEVRTRNAQLEDSVEDICEFVRQGGRTFPFLFIDPTGWTGFAMDVIAPLFRLEPCEVLVNFMTSHILRHIGWPDGENQGSFCKLFGSAMYQGRLVGAPREEREEALVGCYAEAVGQTGRFGHVCPAVVLHPYQDRTHFHLIYATRHRRGVEVFKDAERAAMQVMGLVREQVKERREERKTKQKGLFPEFQDPVYLQELRERYLGRCRLDLRERLLADRRVSYDVLLDQAAAYPLVYEDDIKEWVEAQRAEGHLRVEGPGGEGCKLRRGAGHHLAWENSPPPKQRSLF